MEQPHASGRLAQKGTLAGETLPIHAKTGLPAGGDSSIPLAGYPGKQPSAVSVGAAAASAETADRSVGKISSFGPKPRRALNFTPHAVQGTAEATPATPAAAAAVSAEQDDGVAEGEAVEGKRHCLHGAQQRQPHSVRRHLTASECTGSPQYKRRWHVQQQEQQQRPQRDSRGGEGDAHGRKQLGTQQDGVEARMKEEGLMKVEDESGIGSYRCGWGRSSDSSSKDSGGGCGAVAAAAAEVVALVARGAGDLALHHGAASSAREEAVEDTAVAAAIAAAAAAATGAHPAPAFAAGESQQGSVLFSRADVYALDGASESPMRLCSGGHDGHDGSPQCSAKQEGEQTCSADVVVGGERTVDEERRASRVLRGEEEDKALLSSGGVEGVRNADETMCGRATALQPIPATAFSTAAATGSVDAAATARVEAWEDDPVYCGMAYAGCTHQYTHKHFQRYLARLQRQKTLDDERRSLPTSPPRGLQPHSDWMAA